VIQRMDIRREAIPVMTRLRDEFESHYPNTRLSNCDSIRNIFCFSFDFGMLVSL
jgi:hypothetical protein